MSGRLSDVPLDFDPSWLGATRTAGGFSRYIKALADGRRQAIVRHPSGLGEWASPRGDMGYPYQQGLWRNPFSGP